MMECIGVILSFISKFYKSGKQAKHRHRGFVMNLIVQLFWSCYFIAHDMRWLAFYAVAGMIMTVRGIINNRGQAA